MTIALGGYQFGGSTTYHETPQESDFISEDTVNRWYGVIGSTEIRDTYHDRMIAIPVRITASTAANLNTRLIEIDGKKGVLIDGTLTVTLVLANGYSQPHCSFIGLSRQGGMQLDGSGIYGWYQDGTLWFRQLQRTP